MSRKNKQIHGLDVANHAIETDNIVNIVKEISALTVQLKVNITATSQEILTVTEFIKILLKREQAHMHNKLRQNIQPMILSQPNHNLNLIQLNCS